MSNQEIFFPEASEKPPLADPSQNLSTPKSYVTAYFIWLFLGIIGGHRFYLGKWFTGLLYAVSFGFLGVGWLLDFFLIVPMVKSARKKATLQVLSEANVPEEAPLPAWAKESSFFGLLELPFQIMFFLFFPGILVIFAVLLHQIEFAIMIVVLLALVGLLGSFQKTLLQYPFLDKIPALGDAISIVTDLHKFYYNNKPRSFLYYLFYPVSGFIGILFSEKSRIEFKLYLKILGSLLLVLIIDTIFSYSSLYPPHLDWKDAIFIIFLQLIMMFFALLSLVIPMVSTSFQWNLQGRKRTSQFFTFLGLSLAIFFGNLWLPSR
ncbi:MAG: TM2 domain-containing protein [Candidatus Brocadiae bacterium]|nr:TM2 domain-containing protein [Candidatus Brocadiia bacterium]